MPPSPDPARRSFYTGPVACLCLLPWSLYYEGAVFAAAVEQRPGQVAAFLLGGCCMAVAYNVVFFQCLHSISSVGTSVMANFKIVGVVLLSSLFLGELASWPASQFLGCALTVAGTFWYSHLRQLAA